MKKAVSLFGLIVFLTLILSPLAGVASAETIINVLYTTTGKRRKVHKPARAFR